MKMTLSLTLASLLALLPQASAQSQRIVDSLTAVLGTKVAGDRYSPLYELAFEYLDRDNERALQIIEEAEKAALLSGDSLWIVKSKRVRGQILYKLQRMSAAILFLERSLGIARRNGFDDQCKQIYSTSGLVDLFRGDFDKALLEFDSALQLAEQQRDTVFLISILNNVGLTHFELYDPGKALVHLFRALKLKQQLKRATEVNWASISTNISLCYSLVGQFSNARIYLDKSFRECKNGCSESIMMHQELVAGSIYNGMKKYDQALHDFFSSLSRARKIRDSRLIFDNLEKISEVLIAENRIREAERYLKDAEKLIEPGVAFPISQINVYSRFCQVYEKLGNYKRLAYYQHKYIHLKDSIFNYDLTTRLTSAEVAFKERENKARIEAQEDIILLKEAV